MRKREYAQVSAAIVLALLVLPFLPAHAQSSGSAGPAEQSDVYAPGADLPTIRWEAGKHFSLLSRSAAVGSGPGRVEVRELFMYTSPRSRDVRPFLKEWLASRTQTVAYVRTPSIVFPHARYQARMYFTLLALNREDLTDKFWEWVYDPRHYDTYHTIRHPDVDGYLRQNLDFARENGLNERAFLDTYDSRSVEEQVISADVDDHEYHIVGTSTFLIAGKYSTSLQRIQLAEPTAPWRSLSTQQRFAYLFALIDHLVAQEQVASAALDQRTKAVHSKLLVIDPHVDVLLPTTNERYFLPAHGDRADVSRLRRGDIGAVAFALAVGSGARTPAAVAQARAEIDAKQRCIQRFISKNSAHVALALTAADIERIHAQGKVAVLESFLNARSIGTKVDALDSLYRKGVRIFGLVHSGHNDFSDSSRPLANQPLEEHHGLSPLGRQAIERINQLGGIVDISQMSKAAALQTLKLSTTPVIASHSAARSLVDKARNLSDEELDAIKANGGVVHVTAFNGYLAQVPADMPDRVRALRVRYGLPAEFPGEEFSNGEQVLSEEQGAHFDDELAALYPKAGVTDLVDHIDYMVQRMGIDHVGVGSDFNHGSGIEGFNDESEAPNITRELLRRGYGETEIAKIWGGNFLRVLRAVEAKKGR